MIGQGDRRTARKSSLPFISLRVNSDNAVFPAVRITFDRQVRAALAFEPRMSDIIGKIPGHRSGHREVEIVLLMAAGVAVGVIKDVFVLVIDDAASILPHIWIDLIRTAAHDVVEFDRFWLFRVTARADVHDLAADPAADVLCFTFDRVAKASGILIPIRFLVTALLIRLIFPRHTAGKRDRVDDTVPERAHVERVGGNICPADR